MHHNQALLLLLLMSSCSQQDETKKVRANKHKLMRQQPVASLDSSSFVVLPFSKKSEYVFPKSVSAPLSVTEIERANELLAKAVVEQNEAQEKDYQDIVKQFPLVARHRQNYFIELPKYKRQLIAVLNLKGEKEVWVNCFCGDEDYWRKEVVSVFDGGNCYFNVKINLTTGVWYDMMVNGSA